MPAALIVGLTVGVWFMVIIFVLAYRTYSKIQKKTAEKKRKMTEEKYERKNLGNAQASYGTSNAGFEE